MSNMNTVVEINQKCLIGVFAEPKFAKNYQIEYWLFWRENSNILTPHFCYIRL